MKRTIKFRKKSNRFSLFLEEIASDEVEHGRIQPELPNRLEDKCQDKGSDGHKGEQSRYLDEETLAFVQKYLESAEDAQSVKTETSDSGMDTRSAPSEFEMEERSGKAEVFSRYAFCNYSLGC